MTDEKKDSKNMNKMVIEGDYDKLAQIQQLVTSRFGTRSLKIDFAEMDESELRKMTVPETQENTTARLQAVQERGGSVQMAPNLVNHDALPNDNIDKAIRSGRQTGIDNQYAENKKIAREESEEQIDRLAQYEKENKTSVADASRKEEKPASNKKDKESEGRKTK